MKYLKGIFFYLLAWYIVGTLIFLCSCSAQHHLVKYQKKGGVCGKIDTVQIVDSIPYTVNDTIIWRYYTRDSIVVVNDRIVPKTRLEIRTDYKIHRDTIRLQQTIIKENTKLEKSNSRNSYIWVILVAVLIGIYLIKRN